MLSAIGLYAIGIRVVCCCPQGGMPSAQFLYLGRQDMTVIPRKKNVPRGDGSGRVYEDAIEAGDILLETCGTTVRFDNVLLPTTGTTHQPQSGEVLLGMGFINKFDKVTINMRDKFIAVE